MEEKDEKQDRRAFLAGGLGAAATLAAQGIIEHGAYDGFLNLVDKFHQVLTLPENASRFDERFSLNIAASKSLFPAKRMVKLAGGRAHYQYPNSMHPDDKWACETILQHAAGMANEIRYEPKQPQASPFGSFVCTGSPVSNAWTRYFLEYHPVNAARPELGFLQNDNARLQLPFRFVLSRDIIKRVAKHAWHQAGRWRRVPNWMIESRDGHFFIPNTEEQHNDLLLITKLPNWRERELSGAKLFDNDVLIFAGTHGVGTNAIRLLFDDIPLTEDLLLKTSRYDYWQVLLTVDKMELERHPYSTSNRLVSKSINRYFECEPINI